MADRQPEPGKRPIVVRWNRDGDQCVAQVGEPLEWRRAVEDARRHPGRPGMWWFGWKVLRIDDGPPCWRVWREPEDRGDGWANPVLCSDRVTVTYDDGTVGHFPP